MTPRISPTTTTEASKPPAPREPSTKPDPRRRAQKPAGGVVRLYGRAYDATRWAKVHPGGPAVIESLAALADDNVEGTDDTAGSTVAERLFESYHRDPARNLVALEPYLLVTDDPLLLASSRREASTESPRCASADVAGKDIPNASSPSRTTRTPNKKDAFGESVRRDVYAYLAAKDPRNPRGEGGAYALAKCVVAAALWAFLLADAVRVAQSHTTTGVLSRAFGAGVMLIVWGLIQFHDSSHYAFKGGPRRNLFLTASWSAVAYWVPWLWHRHHVELHHSCTGEYARDPDVRHGAPFMRKTSQAPRRRYLELSPAWQIAAVMLVPGMYFGQTLHYLTVRLGFRTALWKMTHLKPAPHFVPERWELCLGLWFPMWQAALYAQSKSPFLCAAASLFYVAGANITYAGNILPDHDTLASHANHAALASTTNTPPTASSSSSSFINSSEEASWTARQAAASANWAGPLWSCVFGGLNYQIEHHLFPRVHHTLYPDIAPIVRAACARHNVPYVHYPSFLAAARAVYAQLATVRDGVRDDHDDDDKIRTT